MRRTSATTLAQHDHHHHQQQSTAKARTSLIIVALLSGSLQYYYYCNHYCINISITVVFFHCGPKRMSGISISFLYCWYHYTNSDFVCIIATAPLVPKFKTVISFAPPRSWCEAREEVGPDATQKRQFVGRVTGSMVII